LMQLFYFLQTVESFAFIRDVGNKKVRLRQQPVAFLVVCAFAATLLWDHEERVITCTCPHPCPPPPRLRVAMAEQGVGGKGYCSFPGLYYNSPAPAACSFFDGLCFCSDPPMGSRGTSNHICMPLPRLTNQSYSLGRSLRMDFI